MNTKKMNSVRFLYLITICLLVSLSAPQHSIAKRCDLPSNVIDLNRWKLTLPIDKNGKKGNTRKATEVKQPKLRSYKKSPYFRTAHCNSVIFEAPVGGATTSGSGYPRSELREMKKGGKKKASWSSDKGYHVLKGNMRILHVPKKKPHVVIAQIHDGDDDILTLRYEKPYFRVTANGKKVGPKFRYHVEGPKSKWIYVAIFVKNNRTTVKLNGRDFYTYKKKYKNAYFKIGAYTQSACGGKKKVRGERCNDYSKVWLQRLSLYHKY